MRRTAVVILALLICLFQRAVAVDLTRVDRTIAKLPKFRTEQPQFCLLVFGADAHKRVWLVQDGDVLYVDRNGNGDLTEADERIAADPDVGKGQEGVYEFKVGDLSDGALVHKDLVVSTSDISFNATTDEKLKKLLDADPNRRGHRISIDLEMPGRHGRGLGNRVSHTVSEHDGEGYLQFAARPEVAPVVHFGGPWVITFYDQDALRVGNLEKFYLAVGTPGLGPGSTAFVAYEGVIPRDLSPTAKVTFGSASDDQKTIVKSYELTKRCCGINLYGDIKVPGDVATGMAKVEFSLAGWPGTNIASTTHEVTIKPGKPPLKLEPVSSRLKSSLAHSNREHADRDSSMVEIQFSPDGKKIIAGDYPGGVLNVWNVDTGERQVTIDTGNGFRSSWQYFVVAPDWQTVYAPTIRKDRNFEKIERDGKTLTRWTFNDSVRAWDLQAGQLQQSWQHSPAREILVLQLAPDGRTLLTNDGLPGDYEKTYKRALSVWDIATGTSRQIQDGYEGYVFFFPDGKTIALSKPTPDDGSYDECLQLVEYPQWNVKRTIKLPKGNVSVYCTCLVQDRFLIGALTTYSKPRDFEHLNSELKIWDATSGEEVFSAAALEPNTLFSKIVPSPDGKLVAATSRRDRGHGWLYLVDPGAKSVRTVELGENDYVFDPVFHPNGKWVAVPVGPKSEAPLNDDTSPLDLPQPRIQIVDVANAKIVETIVSPQAILHSLTFSPDGKLLATSGHGEVLLWDFSVPPGQKPLDK